MELNKGNRMSLVMKFAYAREINKIFFVLFPVLQDQSFEQSLFRLETFSAEVRTVPAL